MLGPKHSRPRPAVERRAYTLTEAARAAGIRPETYKRLVLRGEAPGVVVGTRIKVGRQALDDWLAGRWVPNPARLNVTPLRKRAS